MVVVTQTYTTGGTTAWVAPAGLNGAVIDSVETWGAGGGGGVATSSEGGGGGGGYSKRVNVAVTIGGSYNAVVGTGGTPGVSGGDSSFVGDAVTTSAKGGVFANGRTSGAGGASASGSGTTKFSGGNGGNGSVGTGVGGGGGGSSAGTAANGNNGAANIGATGGAGGLGPTGGSTGGAGGNTLLNGSNGVGFGAGGGGGGDAPGTAGNGKDGKIVLTYTLNDISVTPAAGTVKSTAVAPSVVLGSVSVTPAVGTVKTATVAPTVVHGSISITPPAVRVATYTLPIATPKATGSLTFNPQFIVAEEATENYGQLYFPHRSRTTCRGRDGKYYTVYDTVNAAGTAGVLRCQIWTFTATGAVSIVQDVKVADTYSGTYAGNDLDLCILGCSVAIDWNGTVERVLVAIAETNFSAPRMRMLYMSTASPATFTAGDTFTIKDDVHTVASGFELFGRRSGADSIHLVYVNVKDTDSNTSIAIVKHRTAASHSASFSAAADVIPAETVTSSLDATAVPDWTIACTRNTNGDIYVAIGVAFFGNRRIALAKWNGAAWSNSTVLSSTTEEYYCMSLAIDMAGALHLAVLNPALVLGVWKSRAKYFKLTTAGAITLQEQMPLDLVLLNIVDTTTPLFQFCFLKHVSIGVDRNGNASLVAMLRADPSTFSFTEGGATKRIYGNTIVFRRDGGSWAGYIPTTRKSGGVLTAHTVSFQCVPHDISVVGKLGCPEAGTMFLEITCNQPLILGPENWPCVSSSAFGWRLVASSDFVPGGSLYASTDLNFNTVATMPLFIKVFANTALGLSTLATHVGTILNRAASSSLAAATAAAIGKSKVAGSSMKFATVATVFKDEIAKFKTSAAIGFATVAMMTRVQQRSATTVLLIDQGPFFALQANTALSFGSAALLGGTIHVAASTSISFATGAAFDPIEGCDTLYTPSPPITADEDDLLFVTLTAPFSVPVKTLTMRRPDYGDDYARALQGETAIARDGTVQTTKRTPNPQRWSVTFSDMTRKQTIELEDFLVAYASQEMLYRDHNNRRWRARVLTSPASWESSGPERWSTTLEFNGTLLS